MKMVKGVVPLARVKLGPKVAEFRELASAAGGLAGLTREERRAYGLAVHKAVRARQAIEFYAGVKRQCSERAWSEAYAEAWARAYPAAAAAKAKAAAMIALMPPIPAFLQRSPPMKEAA